MANFVKSTLQGTLAALLGGTALAFLVMVAALWPFIIWNFADPTVTEVHFLSFLGWSWVACVVGVFAYYMADASQNGWQ